MSSFVVHLADWDTLREHARAVRPAVFVVEQRVPVELEWDEMDAMSWHAVAYDADGAAVGTGRLLPDGHIGRMAVLKSARGAGVGGAILEGLMAKAAELGYRELILNSQTVAMPFYARFGFVPEGDEFMEAGIPHRVMRKKTSS
ncbi:MAG: GNAT family N-acetyltransferase [Steroidobacteraceae bacterium]